MFEVGDRVKRNGSRGGLGTVILLKFEILGTDQEKKDNMMIKVAWDNGTDSFFAKEGLELVKKKVVIQ